jgi:predicted acetyltransferase
MKLLQPPGEITDGEIRLLIDCIVPENPDKNFLPAYHFHIAFASDSTVIGDIKLRIGYTDDLVWYCGHIGYTVQLAYRGHKYAAKACRLLRPLAIQHGLDVLSITCSPDNWASRKTCLSIGAELVSIVRLPPHLDMYKRGDREKCRFRWVLPVRS